MTIHNWHSRKTWLMSFSLVSLYVLLLIKENSDFQIISKIRQNQSYNLFRLLRIWIIIIWKISKKNSTAIHFFDKNSRRILTLLHLLTYIICQLIFSEKISDRILMILFVGKCTLSNLVSNTICNNLSLHGQDSKRADKFALHKKLSKCTYVQ